MDGVVLYFLFTAWTAKYLSPVKEQLVVASKVSPRPTARSRCMKPYRGQYQSVPYKVPATKQQNVQTCEVSKARAVIGVEWT